jgi:hypothetical protein
MKITIDPEFEKLLGERDLNGLEEQILADGQIFHGLVLWKCNKEHLILDGHGRYKVHLRNPTLKLPKHIVLDFESRDEAHDWVIHHQLSRRNCTDAQRKYLLGLLYLKHKPLAGNPSFSRDSSNSVNLTELEGGDTETAADIAEEAGVSVSTLQRSAAFTTALDAVPDIKAVVLDGKVNATGDSLKALAKLAEKQKSAAIKLIVAEEVRDVKYAIAEAKKGGPGPPPPPPEPPKDEWGAPIQKHAAAAFEDVPKFDEVLSLLRKASKLYKDLAEHEGGKLLQRSGISINTRSGFKHAGIANAIRDLQDCKPAYTICPYSVNEHQKHSKDCTLCYGLNWSPKFAKDRVPDRLVEKAKREACST